MENIINNKSYHLSGLFTLSLRLVVGWTYFSAFWRRLFLADKLDPETAGYIGEKFNHFLPNALGIKPIIEYLVTHPEALWWAMTLFTIVEGIVGLLLIFGLLSRLMSIGVIGLAMGILLGSGWIGTTCLDEWQIGVLGIAAGFTLYFTGSGKYSIDYYLYQKNYQFTAKRWFQYLGSGLLPVRPKRLHRIVLIGSTLILFITLFTNQYFHGGVWGDLHNKSVRPKIEISDITASHDALSFQIYRVEGVDVYGSFLIGISLEDNTGNTLLKLTGSELSDYPTNLIQNKYVTQVKPGAHSMVVPLGGKALITIEDATFSSLDSGTYTITLTDISGLSWSETFEV